MHHFQIDFSDWNLYWSLFFGLLCFLIIVLNALSISILFKRGLRKRPHFLLLNLAFADLLVGLIPVPLFIMMADSSIIARFVYRSVDLFAGLSSIFTLAAISSISSISSNPRERLHNWWPLNVGFNCILYQLFVFSI